MVKLIEYITEGVNKHVDSGLFTGKILKPFDPEQLLTNIKTILSGETPSII